jgi:hypothetical protein
MARFRTAEHRKSDWHLAWTTCTSEISHIEIWSANVFLNDNMEPVMAYLGPTRCRSLFNGDAKKAPKPLHGTRLQMTCELEPEQTR